MAEPFRIFLFSCKKLLVHFVEQLDFFMITSLYRIGWNTFEYVGISWNGLENGKRGWNRLIANSHTVKYGFNNPELNNLEFIHLWIKESFD